MFVEDERRIVKLIIQKYGSERGPSTYEHFTFTGSAIETLINFLASIKTIPLVHGERVQLTSEEIRDLLLNEAQARRLLEQNEDLFRHVAQSAELQRDLIAIGYRRKQLERFQRLLRDPAFFAAEREQLRVGPEALWQAFFEANPWIFGYGLSYLFVTALDDRKLEQVVRGFDVTGPGKRVDAMMKTQAQINSLCFVEIKRHDAPLLASAYRPGAWPVSGDLSGGVAQVQATVQDAIERIGRKLDVHDKNGDPTGEILFNVEPRSFLVIGNLNEFTTSKGVNEGKFRSFETYRRNMRRPEIITFDELLYRARFIVENDDGTPPRAAPESVLDDDVPF